LHQEGIPIPKFAAHSIQDTEVVLAPILIPLHHWDEDAFARLLLEVLHLL